MILVCPHCNRPLPPSDEPPRFCAFCGQRLRGSTEEVTRDLNATTGDSSGGGSDPEAAPAEIGGYRIGRILGAGGMGRVYEAEPVSGGPKVALKILSGRLQANPTSVERFRQEGRLAAQIAHPRCVFVLGADTDAGRPYIVMELMPGDTLKEVIDRRGTVPAVEAIRFTLDVIDGLREAHRLGVIHRDVKPSNCFLRPDGRVKVGDFGLSKSLGGSAQLTQSGAFLGTILYASPEQIKGEPVDYASDVYSVCATLYHLLAGRAPFHHENPTAVLAKIISEDAPPIRSVNPAVPADLARVVHRGLERDRDRRYATLAELRADLAALVPEQLTFGGLGVRVGAYLIDEAVVRMLFMFPAHLVLSLWLNAPTWLDQGLPLLFFPIYFAAFEGFFGWSIGKRLLGLRVCRQGTTLPPGIRKAALRTLVFYILITLTLSPAIINSNLLGSGSLVRELILNVSPFLIGLMLLVVPMRRSNDFRGLHEKASGTCVLRLPQVPRPLTLIGRHGDRLEALSDRPPSFPSAIGPYAIRKAVASDGGWLAVGDDAMLSRRVLLWLLRGNAGAGAGRPAVGRPGRLWLLGRGSIAVGRIDHQWEAFVAPTGAPLADVVDATRPVYWPEARPVLEGLAEELAAAEADGSLPPVLSLGQVWVAADGRPQLLDFPLTSAATVSPATLVRQAAATLLEGRHRPAEDATYPRAPVPKHAGRLFAALPGPATSVADFRREAAATRVLPARVTRGARAIQLAVHTLVSAPGLIFMLFASSIYPLIEVLSDEAHMARLMQVTAAERLLAVPPDSPSADPLMADTERADGLRSRAAREKARLIELEPALNPVERTFLNGYVKASNSDEPAERTNVVREWAASSETDGLKPIAIPWLELIVALWVWPIICAIEAFILRGSASNLLTGVLIVRARGGRAGRRQCAARALVGWVPVTVLLISSVLMRTLWPWNQPLYEILWAIGILTLPIAMLAALIDPERGPADRLAGTWLVPR